MEGKRAEIPTSAYLHIPFCRRRCYYCDFPVFVVGDRQQGENSRPIVEYVAVLQEEINTTPSLGQPLTTVFFGGGTPSLLSVEQLDRILTVLDRRFGIANDAEISIEMDPGTFESQQLAGYRAAGINRVSLGVQAFQDELLAATGRSHNSADILTAVESIRQVGITNFSLDLISGLPHQTLAQWQHSLEAAVAIAPVHISSYDLIVEPKTPFARYYQPGVAPLPSDDLTAEMYRLASQILSDAGYQHYEVSNYALAGYECLHNQVYWENRPYYGFGMGAASYVGGKRFTRPRKTREYYAWVERLKANGGAIDCAETPASEVMLESLMLGLRLARGWNLATLSAQLNRETRDRIWTSLQPYARAGWLQVVSETGTPITLPSRTALPPSGWLRLTDPEGFLFSNTILASVFSALE